MSDTLDYNNAGDVTIEYTDPDATIEYSDEDPDATIDYTYVCDNRLYHSSVNPQPAWWTTAYTTLPTRLHHGPSDFHHDYLMHAIHDAELLLYQANLEESSTLPWTVEESFFVIPGPWRHSRCFYYDPVDDECFSVSSDDILTPQDVIENFSAVEKGDRKEIESFVQHQIYKLAPRSKSDNTVDGVWVRKWADRKNKIVKSRCCSRGFLDRQKDTIDRHSSTASRLSHRMAVSLGVQHGLVIESLDISTAFLQGLKFSEVVTKAAELGHEVKQARKVWFKPPANVWRHLREIPQSGIFVQDEDIEYFILELLKALYGLVDGPLLWQLALANFMVKELHFRTALHDENFFYITDGWKILAIYITHVDDILTMASQDFLDWAHDVIYKKFGKVKRCVLPLIYVGVRHQLLAPDHILLDQGHYIEKLKPAQVSSSTHLKDDTRPLDAFEHKQFRSLLCSLLWVCLTRMDLCHGVVALQSEMIKPTILHLKQVNQLLKRALSTKHFNGLHFRRLRFPLRLVSVNDASHASKRSGYPYEGKIVLLMSESDVDFGSSGEWYRTADSQSFTGYGHPLYFTARKASRVSHSTSHAETNACVGGLQVAQLVSSRITEMFAPMYLGRYAAPHDLLRMQNANIMVIPCDAVTDCMDLYELVTGQRGLTNDKTQRISIMALREDRLTGRCRRFTHVPTSSMLSDGLTKLGQFPLLLTFCTTGKWVLHVSEDKWIRVKVRSLKYDYTEEDIRTMTT
jgi:hypothetical protein